MCVCVHECSAGKDKKRVLDPLECKLQMTVNCLMQVLGTISEASAKAGSAVKS